MGGSGKEAGARAARQINKRIAFGCGKKDFGFRNVDIACGLRHWRETIACRKACACVDTGPPLRIWDLGFRIVLTLSHCPHLHTTYVYEADQLAQSPMDTHFHFWMASACLNANWNRKFWMIGKWSGSGIGIGMGSRWPSSPSAHFHISCSDTLEKHTLWGEAEEYTLWFQSKIRPYDLPI